MQKISVSVIFFGICILLKTLLFSSTAKEYDQDQPFLWLPGAARAIARSQSASRDRPVFEYAYGPTAQASIAGEWAWFKVRRENRTFYFGFYAMMGMENHDWYVLFPPSQLWRGMTGFTWSWSLEDLASRLFGPGGKFELGLVFGHESDHGYMSDPPKPDDIPDGGGGDFITPDIAIQKYFMKDMTFISRLQCRLYGYGSLIAAPGADIILRWHLNSWCDVSLPIFYELLFPRKTEAQNGYFFRILPGLVFIGDIGEFTFFISFDSGNGKGKLINHRNNRYSFGIRYAPFSQ
ncbi:MAG: hypothetical protein PVI26_11965 [Chitinispirillia bacterium]